MFWTFYVVSVIYCLVQVSKRWNKDAMPGGLGISPGLDTLAILFLAPFLMLVDATLTWVKLYKDAEESRRNQTKL